MKLKYLPLFKIYHQDPDHWDAIRDQRYNFEFSTRLPIEIKEYGREKTYDAFFCYTNELVEQLQEVSTQGELLRTLIEHLPPVMYNNLTTLFIIEEIKATNQIEGIHSSRRQLKKALLSLDSPSKFRFKSVLSKYKTIIDSGNIEFNFPQDIRKFYDEFVLDEVDEKDRPDGILFRADSVDVTTKTGKIIHRGSFPEKKIIKDMNIALSIFHDNSIPSIVRIATFHYLFGYIHPFYDGNGRTSRFISSYYLAKEIHPLVGLRLSATIKNDLTKYYDMFRQTNAEINGGDLTFFILSFIEYILNCLKELISILKTRNDRLCAYKEKLDKFLEQNEVTDKTTTAIYFVLLQARLFSIAGGVRKQELEKALRKSRSTIDARFKKIPTEHYTVKKSGRAEVFELNLNILKQP